MLQRDKLPFVNSNFKIAAARPKYRVMFLCPCWSLRPGGRPGVHLVLGALLFVVLLLVRLLIVILVLILTLARSRSRSRS